MSDFNLPRESVTELMDYDVLVTENENTTEQRRLRNQQIKLGFKVKTPDLTKTQAQSYRSLFQSKYGALTSFTFTNPIDDIEYTVRFVEGSFKTTFVRGYFKCEFEFKRVLL